MKSREITAQVVRLGALPYFPADDDARIAIAEIFAASAVTIEQVQWTVKRCLAIWDKWEGPHELRAVLCSRFRPADGINTYSRLPQFADGIPSESEERNQELLGGAGEQKRLPVGEAVNLLREAATPRERDRLDDISEAMERGEFIRKAHIPNESEIERIRLEQEAKRDPDAAEKLARELGIK